LYGTASQETVEFVVVWAERRFDMGKRARKSKARKKKKANHGKRPIGR
jgi:hypothetical protein